MTIVIGGAASGASRMQAAGPVMVIGVPGFDAVVLRCDRTVLRDAFGDRAWDNPALDVNAFSASDLWFCTV
jgi:hypothetical protein